MSSPPPYTPFETDPSPQYRSAQDSNAEFDAALERLRALDRENALRSQLMQASQETERAVSLLATTQQRDFRNLERTMSDLTAQVSRLATQTQTMNAKIAALTARTQDMQAVIATLAAQTWTMEASIATLTAQSQTTQRDTHKGTKTPSRYRRSVASENSTRDRQREQPGYHRSSGEIEAIREKFKSQGRQYKPS